MLLSKQAHAHRFAWRPVRPRTTGQRVLSAPVRSTRLTARAPRRVGKVQAVVEEVASDGAARERKKKAAFKIAVFSTKPYMAGFNDILSKNFEECTFISVRGEGGLRASV